MEVSLLLKVKAAQIKKPMPPRKQPSLVNAGRVYTQVGVGLVRENPFILVVLLCFRN